MTLGRFARVGFVTLGAMLAAAGTGPASAPPRADAAIRARIEQAVAAVVRQDDNAGERFDALREVAMGRRQEVLLQLALYLSEATGTEQSMAGALILQRLEFTPDEKLDVALPNLDSVGPALRRVLTEVLGTIDRTEGGDPDFRLYEARLLKDRPSPPPALIHYMFEVSPDAALRSLERAYGGGGA
ncbi:MAG TPA: hypothetical protein VFG76_09540, partial [Candidatus Polarisedimenticolia bacterium]|nr:hypothetical protein [Candidatus Polarisedimenticolia bacterium]